MSPLTSGVTKDATATRRPTSLSSATALAFSAGGVVQALSPVPHAMCTGRSWMDSAMTTRPDFVRMGMPGPFQKFYGHDDRVCADRMGGRSRQVTRPHV